MDDAFLSAFFGVARRPVRPPKRSFARKGRSQSLTLGTRLGNEANRQINPRIDKIKRRCAPSGDISRLRHSHAGRDSVWEGA